MDYNKAALELHSKFPGKIAVQSLCECKDRDALSTAYTPGVAEPCRKIKANPDDVYTYTMKGRTVAVVTNGTAVLGLGNIGPEAGSEVSLKKTSECFSMSCFVSCHFMNCIMDSVKVSSFCTFSKVCFTSCSTVLGFYTHLKVFLCAVCYNFT